MSFKLENPEPISKGTGKKGVGKGTVEGHSLKHLVQCLAVRGLGVASIQTLLKAENKVWLGAVNSGGKPIGREGGGMKLVGDGVATSENITRTSVVATWARKGRDGVTDAGIARPNSYYDFKGQMLERVRAALKREGIKPTHADLKQPAK